MKPSILTAILILSMMTSFLSCGGQKTPPTDNTVNTGGKQNWYQYISAHTAGTVSKKSKISVVFRNNVVESGAPITDAKDMISISPAIKGKVEWKNARSLELTPAQELEPGQRYEVTLHLDKQLDLPKDMADYRFDFSVLKQNMELTVHPLAASTKPNDDSRVLKGMVKTADIAEHTQMAKVLRAFQEGMELPVAWTKGNNITTHHFTIQDIQRKETESTVTLKWNGEALGVTQSGERTINVPALGLFKVTEVKAVKGKQQYILVNFSDALDKTQDLSGLIRADAYGLKYTIDGNSVRAYPSRTFVGAVTVTVERGIKNNFRRTLEKTTTHSLTFETIKPAVRFVGKNGILPQNNRLTVPFEAVSLHSVQVTAMQIYSNNMGHFLQNNSLQGNNELTRVGRYLWRKTIPLSDDPEITSRWNRYHLDVTSLLKKHPGSLFRLIITFNRNNSAYPCTGTATTTIDDQPLQNQEEWQPPKENSNWDYCENYYNQDAYNNWANRDNPCTPAYYNPAYNKDTVMAERNFIASNIGLIAKMGRDNILKVVTTDIRTAEPMNNVKITAYNFQDQPVGKGTSDASGMVQFQLGGQPFYLAAETDNDTGYLKVSDGASLPLSHFDIAGVTVNGGIKGHIYGERGVWRPGDTLHLTFVLEDKNNILPKNHPVLLELINPKGQSVQKLSPTRSLSPFHAFTITTDETAVTGNWKARVLVGGLTFDRTIKIETVVPNRLKVQLDLGNAPLCMDKMPLKAEIFSQWLHGAPADGLKATMKVTFSPRPTRFATHGDYVFDDPARQFSGGEQTVFDSHLDAEGKAQTEMNLQVEGEPQGMLNASFQSRVFENGGGFSIDGVTVPFHPYSGYVGLKTPKGDAARGMLLTDIDHTVHIATVDTQGKPVSRDNIEAAIYQINWKWWWDKSKESLAQYASASTTRAIYKGTVSTKDGMGQWKFKIKYPSWGRYLIRVYDPVTKHAAGKIVYIDWPGWAGRARQENGTGATRLNFNADKDTYNVGEKATVFLPETINGRALVSIETGTAVLKQMWTESTKGNNKFTFQTTPEMSPNIYVHVTMLQPHKDKKSDTPIRLYGVIPITVNNPDTRLHPVIKTADQYAPQEKIEVEISEQQSRAMTYTLALVDEGLLGLTRYQTPDLRNEFYKREALGVKTWDLFDDVAGAYGAQLERLLALGGDDAAKEKGREKKKRFPPVVIFKGPFHLEKDKTETHQLQLPQYVGAVRVMVIAGHHNAYGSTEKTVPVKKDLMLLANLPRVLRPNEEILLPVTLFVMNEKLKTVAVTVETDEMFTLPDGNRTETVFPQPGEGMTFFKLKTANRKGEGIITIHAKGDGFQARQTIHMPVHPCNPPTTRIESATITPGESWTPVITPHGIADTNKITVEIASMPALNLEKHLQYLIGYPHGCLEQTLSKIFPQLYLSSLTELSPEQKTQVENHVKAAIKKLRLYQNTAGGFGYWPGAHNPNDWGTNYAGHFLLEASRYGYHVPEDMLERWLDHQTAAANAWTAGDQSSRLTQSFRLYTLALARKPDLGAMNRMREIPNPQTTVAVQLAAAYFLVGQNEAAEDMLRKIKMNFNDYRELAGTFGSNMRDKALTISCLTQMGRYNNAKKLIDEIVAILGSQRRLSTQEAAYGLMAAAAFHQSEPGNKDFRFNITVGNTATQHLHSKKRIFKQTLTHFPLTGAPIKIQNTGNMKISAVIHSEGTPAAGQEETTSNKINLKIQYLDMNNNTLSPTTLHQGDDIIAAVTVSNETNTKYDNLALSHMFPSGWQIHNPRFNTENHINAPSDYQDIRDDRIHTYFSLPPKSQKTFRILLNTSYTGKYYLPAVTTQAMYDASIQATLKGQWVEVVR